MLEWQFIENMLPMMGCIKQFQQIHFYITTLVMHDFFWTVKFIVNEHVCISRQVLIKLSEGAIHKKRGQLLAWLPIALGQMDGAW